MALIRGCNAKMCSFQNHGVVTDFVSFYTLPSSVMHHPTYKTLKAAYSFYNVSGATPWVDLITDALIIAKLVSILFYHGSVDTKKSAFFQNNYDVFNALDLMENKEFLEKLKFGIGDGNLQYYLYNWRCPSMPASKVRKTSVIIFPL